MHVVGVDHIGSHATDGARHVVRLEPARHEAPCRLRAADGVTGALKHFHLVAVLPQKARDVCDRALLAALQSIAVM
jgi:hypothetical protein